MTADSTKSSTSAANELIKGLVWGFVAFVHVLLVTVITYKLALDCLPATIVEKLACTPPDSAKCAMACAPSSDFMFYVLAGVTALAFVFLPLGFGTFWVIKYRETSRA